MLSHVWIKVGSKLPYEKLYIHFDFRHNWSTFVWVIPFCSKFVSGLFVPMLSHIWMKVGSKLPYKDVQIRFDFPYSWLTFSSLISLFQTSFSGLFFHIPEWKLVASFHTKSYRSHLTFVQVHIYFNELLRFVQNHFPDFTTFRIKRNESSLKHKN